MTTWQVASGSHGRDYAEEFLRFGMAFVGGSIQIETIKKVRAEDRIILKRGQSNVVAVGRVVERGGTSVGYDDKPWLRDFDGWDLPAYCYVEWHKPEEPIKVRGLTRATIQQVHQPRLVELAEQVIRDVPGRKEYDPEPTPTKKIEDSEILEFLIKEGLRPAAAEDLTAAFRRIRLLAQYYYHECDWKDIREHETRTFLIMPLLLSLGWAEQQIKIELPAGKQRRIDVACFDRSYRRKKDGSPNNEDCVLILESKGFQTGLDYAPEQAKQYAEEFPKCRVVVVSNGYCYKTYPKVDGIFPLSPSAYLNLLKPQSHYPLNPEAVEGALEVLRQLLPQSWR